VLTQAGADDSGTATLSFGPPQPTMNIATATARIKDARYRIIVPSFEFLFILQF
jgi:hypothetical protein